MARRPAARFASSSIWNRLPRLNSKKKRQKSKAKELPPLERHGAESTKTPQKATAPRAGRPAALAATPDIKMGNCKSRPSAANAPNANGLVATYLKPPSKLPPFTASTDLFLELGVPLLGRPSPNELFQLFHEHDADHNDVLNVTEAHRFLQAVSNAYGNGSWDKTSGSSSSRKNLPSNALLGEKNVLSWDEVRSALWDRPVFGVPSPIVLLFREEFRKRLPKDGRTSALTRVEASKLARRLLVAAHVTKDDANAVSKHLLDAPSVSAVGNGKALSAASEGNQVTLEDFVASVGPAYTALSPNHNAFVGLEDDIDGDLSLGTKIRSFAPVRDDTSVEILNCGEAIMRSIIHVLDEATTEICMSWFDFVHDLPAVRSESLGANAWSNESGTLPSLLRQKASKGVKVYIMLWNSLDLVMPTAPLVEHAIRNLGKLHPNITVVSHPGLNVWTHTHHQKFVVVDRRVAIVGGLDWAFKRFDTPAHPLFDPKSSLHPGVDLFSDEVNGPPYKRNVALYFRDKQKDVIANRSEVAAKPWQDVAVWLKGDAAADVALNFIQRWQWARQDTVELFGDGLRNDMPEIPMQIRFLRRPNPDAEAVDDKTRKILTPGGLPSSKTLNKKSKCQIVRSLGQWSGGFSPSEISHYEAWISAISEAKDYIYIESQYFISNMGEGAAHNRIAEAILLRALHAIEEGRPFRIYCVIPTTVAAEPVSYYTRRTLIQDGRGRGEACLMSRIGTLLKTARADTFWHGKSPESMLSVCTLFSADKSESGRWEVGEIFVHSKVLVVDDRVAIIGSANINDRSMVGYSDSELGTIIWDDGNSSVRDFRLRLWRRYLGLPLEGNADDLVAEPATDATFETWSECASDNLSLLSHVTSHTPRDEITTYSELKLLKEEYLRKTPKEREASMNEPELLKGMQGQLVKFPPKFLSSQVKKSIATKLSQTFDLAKVQFL